MESSVSLSDQERSILSGAGSAAEQSERGQAVAIVLEKSGDELAEARMLLAESYASTIQPSFHLIPRGNVMASEEDFTAAYATLAQATNDFAAVSPQTLGSAVVSDGTTLAPLRMIIGFTHNELAAAIRLIDPDIPVSGNALKVIERREPPTTTTAIERREKLVGVACAAILAVMDGTILTVPEASEPAFHSKLDKRDTREQWTSVAHNAKGVPYSALLYQRYVGGVWRQVQDAYSEIKGDALLEVPLALLLEREEISHYRAPRGAAGAAQTAQRFGISPGPDFLLPEANPTVVVESKIGEDGGTVRDKAARLKDLAVAGSRRGLVVCAVVDGKGWTERLNSLADVIIATGGRTFTLETLESLISVPEVDALRGIAT
ncbi:MAG TPA: hypothetical protein VFM94_03920 [Solirubrobacterales bacterium]|nr:hypothetical protein [Solirubrobacterales bacterium]